MHGHEILLSTVLLAACGASQTEPRGQVFCESYEEHYLGDCRAHCEATREDGDEVDCKAKCTEDLEADATYSESCR
jgi:hypothetical protein